MSHANVITADSQIDFSTTQGHNGWFYGFFNNAASGDGQYQASKFQALTYGVKNSQGYINTSWHNDSALWTLINKDFVHPNGYNSGGEQWSILRYVVPTNGHIQFNAQFEPRQYEHEWQCHCELICQ